MFSELWLSLIICYLYMSVIWFFLKISVLENMISEYKFIIIIIVI